MTIYRQTANKIYNKIVSIAQEGVDGVYNYYLYVDEIINNGQYQVFEDVLITKFDIDFLKYLSVYDLKRDTYHKIRKSISSNFQTQLQAIYVANNVYPVGIHYYDSTTNIYLGDIVMIEQPQNWIAYEDPDLINIEPASLNGQIQIYWLEASVGNLTSTFNAIAPFPGDTRITIPFNLNTQVSYLNNIYQCTQPYIWSKSNQILPTNADYWMVVYPPAYGSLLVNSNTVTLLNKYILAINFLRESAFCDPSLNAYIVSNYMDDYYE